LLDALLPVTDFNNLFQLYVLFFKVRDLAHDLFEVVWAWTLLHVKFDLLLLQEFLIILWGIFWNNVKFFDFQASLEHHLLLDRVLGGLTGVEQLFRLLHGDVEIVGGGVSRSKCDLTVAPRGV
jgi:hypothetical protein